MEQNGKRIDAPPMLPPVQTREPRREQSFPTTIGNTQPQQRVRALVTTVAAVGIVTVTPTAVIFTVKQYDTAGIWNGTTKLTVLNTGGKVTGPWRLYGKVLWAGDTAGTFRKLQIRRNGTTMISTTTQQPEANPQTEAVEIVVNDPSAGDYYELVVSHDAGHNVNISGDLTEAMFNAVHDW